MSHLNKPYTDEEMMAEIEAFVEFNMDESAFEELITLRRGQIAQSYAFLLRKIKEKK